MLDQNATFPDEKSADDDELFAHVHLKNVISDEQIRDGWQPWPDVLRILP